MACRASHVHDAGWPAQDLPGTDSEANAVWCSKVGCLWACRASLQGSKAERCPVVHQGSLDLRGVAVEPRLRQSSVPKNVTAHKRAGILLRCLKHRSGLGCYWRWRSGGKHERAAEDDLCARGTKAGWRWLDGWFLGYFPYILCRSYRCIGFLR